VGNHDAWQTASTGLDHTCGIHSGALYCWGNNAHGALGVGKSAKHLAASAEPLRVGTFRDWQTVDAGNNFTCAIRAGALYCWGNHGDGQLGDGT
jgi:alpha-tubulin suppressor-like RCC1 family protein